MFWLTVQYAKLYGAAKDKFGVNIRGLGFLLNKIDRDREITVHGIPVWMSHEVSQCYGRLIAGQWNEPETHTFLNRVFDRLHQPGTFVDVGANVGEIILDLASNPKVAKGYALEPIQLCSQAILKSLALGGVDSKVSTLQTLCGEKVGNADFKVSRHVSDSAIVHGDSISGGESAGMTTLDMCVTDVVGELVILADVEGYEVQVLRGARNLIESHRPLIVFEYNQVSKASFSVCDVRSLLGSGYTIWRLRGDGMLDEKVEEAWNCVAVPLNSNFQIATADMIVRK